MTGSSTQDGPPQGGSGQDWEDTTSPTRRSTQELSARRRWRSPGRWWRPEDYQTGGTVRPYG
eukprot:5392384-Heterocapsa_arctica.AAC.1